LAAGCTGFPHDKSITDTLNRPKKKENSPRLVVDISSDVWNPQLVEFTAAALQDGDAPAPWVAAAHQTRYLAAHHDDATVLPHVLHLARLAGQYLQPAHQLDDKIEVPDS